MIQTFLHKLPKFYIKTCRKSMLIDRVEFVLTFSKLYGNSHKTFWGISKSLIFLTFLYVP